MHPPDALDTVGTILTGDMGRDAVHFALLSAQLQEATHACSSVGIVSTKPMTVSCYVDPQKWVGIVDPFLRKKFDIVPAGSWVWIFLYPKTISGLTHVWKHPLIPDGDLKCLQSGEVQT